MKISEGLSGVRKLYIETAPIIYFTEKVEPFAERVYGVFAQVVSGKVVAVTTSTITLTEALTKPLREKDAEVEKLYREMLLDSGSFVRVPVTDTVAQRAATLRAQYNLRTPDALHVATALESGCEALLTNDAGFRRIGELRILVVNELELDPSLKEEQTDSDS